MRARHWNDVIAAVGTSFPHSDAAVFCVGHVMDCTELLEQKAEIEVQCYFNHLNMHKLMLLSAVVPSYCTLHGYR
jgi:hypothetical protein